MSTLPSPALASVHLVAAYSSVEPDFMLQAFLDPARAQAFLQELRDYETTRPPLDANATDEKFEAAYAACCILMVILFEQKNH